MTDCTLIGLFDHYDDANRTVRELNEAGIPRSRIAILTNNAAGDHPAPASNPLFAQPEPESGEDGAVEMGLGIGAGAAMGGLFGVLVKVSSLVIPGIGPVIAAGPWVLIFSTIGAALGGGLEALSDGVIPPEDAALYAEGLRRGGTLVAVQTFETDLERWTALFQANKAIDIETRVAAWRAAGWVGFSADNRPLSSAEIAALKQRDAGHEARHRKAIRHYFPLPGKQRLGGVSNQTTRYAEDRLHE